MSAMEDSEDIAYVQVEIELIQVDKSAKGHTVIIRSRKPYCI